MECPTNNFPARLCALEEQVAQLLVSVGHPAATLTFSAGPNSWDGPTQVGNVNVPVIPATPDPEAVTTADATSRAALAPTKFNQFLIQTADATNGNYSIWVPTGLAAGNWTLKVGSLGAQNSDAVSITGGTITGITDLDVADGGTGASNPAGARQNLALASLGDTASDIDWSLSDNFYILLAANTALTFSGEVDGTSIMVAIRDNTGYTLSFPATVNWPGGTPPAPSGVGFTDVYAFTRIAGVTYASVVQGYPNPTV